MNNQSVSDALLFSLVVCLILIVGFGARSIVRPLYNEEAPVIPTIEEMVAESTIAIYQDDEWLGHGAIISHSFNKTYALTANHIFVQAPEEGPLTAKFIYVSPRGETNGRSGGIIADDYPMKLLSGDVKSDLALFMIDGNVGRPAPLGSQPKHYEAVHIAYSYRGSAKMTNSGYVIKFSVEDDECTMWVHGYGNKGLSGTGFYDDEGYIVGILLAVPFDLEGQFPFAPTMSLVKSISIGACTDTIYAFLRDNGFERLGER